MDKLLKEGIEKIYSSKGRITEIVQYDEGWIITTQNSDTEIYGGAMMWYLDKNSGIIKGREPSENPITDEDLVCIEIPEKYKKINECI